MNFKSVVILLIFILAELLHPFLKVKGEKGSHILIMVICKRNAIISTLKQLEI